MDDMGLITSILERLNADVAATGVADVEGRADHTPEGARITWRLTGGTTPLESWVPAAGGSEAAAVEAAACLQDLLVRDGRITGSAGWPACPSHGDHPLIPRVAGEVAAWSCDRDGGVIRIGDLG